MHNHRHVRVVHKYQNVQEANCSFRKFKARTTLQAYKVGTTVRFMYTVRFPANYCLCVATKNRLIYGYVHKIAQLDVKAYTSIRTLLHMNRGSIGEFCVLLGKPERSDKTFPLISFLARRVSNNWPPRRLLSPTGIEFSERCHHGWTRKRIARSQHRRTLRVRVSGAFGNE